MIDMGLTKADIGYPVADELKKVLLDQAVEHIGTTAVMKRDMYEVTADSRTEYPLLNRNGTDKIYKVEVGDDNLPFISEHTANTSTDSNVITNNGWFVKRWDYGGVILGLTATDATPSVCTLVTENSYNESTTPGYIQLGELIELSGIEGFDPKASGLVHPFNGQVFSVLPAINNEEFTFTCNQPEDTNMQGGNHSSYVDNDKGRWKRLTYTVKFLKAPEGKIRVYYYAKPEKRKWITDAIDLPDILCPAAVYHVLGHIISLDGQLQIGSGYRGMSRSLIDDYKGNTTRREAYPDILPQPMQDFVNHQ